MESMRDAEEEQLIPDESRPMTRAEYELLARQGCYDAVRVELLFGRVYEMSPPEPPHVSGVYFVHRYLYEAIGRRAQVLCQTSFAASDISEPEPDIFVVPWGRDVWKEPATSAHLVVEVCNTSHYRDRVLKTKLYAMAEVDEYWTVDLPKGRVEVYRDRDRDGAAWRTRSVHARGETISPLAYPEVVIPVSEIVPPIGS